MEHALECSSRGSGVGGRGEVPHGRPLLEASRLSGRATLGLLYAFAPSPDTAGGAPAAGIEARKSCSVVSPAIRTSPVRSSR